LSTNGISAIAADLRHEHADVWGRFLADCALAGIPVYHSKQLAESLTGKVEIEHLSENTFGSLLPNMSYLKVKQVADILLALLALPAFAVLLAVVAPLIVVNSGWPVFFFQQRIGCGGRIFRVCKFRTMAPLSGDATRDAAITKSGDSRITPIGRVLRKYRIDELPQILNILRGEMSWIGPRPEALTLSRWYEAELPFYRYRHVVMPGITGWAQVNQGHVASPDQVLEKLHYDFFYIKNISPWLDLVIFLRTIRTILSGFGAK
jgi:lipopolysaccharide/colanic/teichoic acid biosynthesis glycosyltransferase